ncbi:putative methyltransferase NSUN7 [Chrysoperla carnea]|uniref:putative methyltransferase NSUN7 n=1 Tax=Chrysoperla carnea TaxID=189513 RepID=UPI001D077BF9|nr:putative methyltransferase NSUN7 [Chrysoperla carnea]
MYRVPSGWTPTNTEEKLISKVLEQSGWDTCDQNETKPQKCRIESETLITKKSGQVDWNVSDIIKAGGLLAVPSIDVQFEHEQEMRRVFSLVYDVLRYKNILNQALKDVAFFKKFPKLQDSTAQVWLLLYDLYHRKFAKRDPHEKILIDTANYGLTDIDDALWRYRIKLAASVSRLRIKNSALRLSQLLPPHLQDERVANAAETTSVTCWINTYIVKLLGKCAQEKLNTHFDILHENNFTEYKEGKGEALGVNEYRWDPICPQFIAFHPSQRIAISQFELVDHNNMIVQDRAFCLGPVVFTKLLLELELVGSVIQTHINSPRATAYLGSLLSKNSNITKLYAFGAGSRKQEFENYMNNIGADNINVYAERLVDVSPDSSFLEHVTAVFATPPNSYSAVTDPIDLVCSRGGDLSMLQVLTESDINEDGRKRVVAILEEQRLTLKFAMSRPQIQFVLYETHSVVEAENQHMVKRVVYEVNRFTRERHAEQQGKLIPMPYKVASDNYMDINNNDENNDQQQLDVKENADNNANTLENEDEEFKTSEYKRFSFVAEKLDSEIDPYRDLEIPDCDVFEEATLPEICSTADCCSILKEEGCYLALLKRKDLTHLNDKYMINIAESRGLFGVDNKDSSAKKTVSSKAVKKKEESQPKLPNKNKKKSVISEGDLIARIGAQTYASKCRYNKLLNLQNSSSKDNLCPRRHYRPQTSPQLPRALRWWKETTKHIMTHHNDNISNDEKTKQDSSTSSIGVLSDSCLSHPRLRLTRSAPTRKKKISVPLHVNTVVMPKFARLI